MSIQYVVVLENDQRRISLQETSTKYNYQEFQEIHRTLLLQIYVS